MQVQMQHKTKCQVIIYTSNIHKIRVNQLIIPNYVILYIPCRTVRLLINVYLTRVNPNYY